MSLPFSGPFEEAMALEGPGAVFTLSASGELRLNVARTRDAWSNIQGPLVKEFCHCLFCDRATGWAQYVLVTSPALCVSHPRAEISRFSSYEEALSERSLRENTQLNPSALSGQATDSQANDRQRESRSSGSCSGGL